MENKKMIDFNSLSAEEVAACVDVITKIREEKRKALAIESAKSFLRDAVMAVIDTIGVEETKRIVREINRDLREQ